MNKVEFITGFNTMILLLYSVSFFIDNASNSGICFGVRLPKEYMDNEYIRSIRKNYKIIVTIIFITIFVVVNALVIFGEYSSERLELILGIAATSSIILFNLPYFPCYFKMKRLKAEKGWNRKRKNVIMTDTTLIKPNRKEKIRTISTKCFSLALIIPFSLMVLTYVKSRDLTMKISHLYRIPLYEILTWILMCFINYIITKAKTDLNSGSIEKAVIRKKRFRRVNSIFIFVITIFTMIMISVKQLELLYSCKLTALYNILNVIMAIISVVFLGALIKVGQGGSNISEEDEEDELYKDDDNNWILGEMYFNPKDPAWMVEKRRGIGWTINFGNVKSWIIFCAVILMCIVMQNLL